jgi:superfamily I DNA/RNA helicase
MVYAVRYHFFEVKDWALSQITISTIHSVNSVKGLDYSCVFLLGLDSLKPKGWTEDQTNNLVYVAITRARYQLFIPYIHESSVIKRLKNIR